MTIIGRIAHCLVLALIFSGLTACSNPEIDKETYLKNALDYIEKDQKDAAILELRSAIQLDAKYAEARYQLGLLYLEKGEARKASGELIRASDLDEDNLDASLKAAQFYLLSRQKDDSRKKIEHILSKDPNHRDALALLANLELIDGNYEAASKALHTIGNELDSSDQLQNIKGRIHAAQEQWDDAEEAFTKAITVNDTNIANYQILLRLYEQRKQREKAKSLIDQMVVKFPENTKPHLLLAGFYRSTGQQKLVAKELQKVVELSPDNPNSWLQLADFFRQSGKNIEAESTLKKAQGHIVKNSDITASLASLYFDLNQFVNAKSLLDELKEAETDHGGTRLLSARFLLKAGEVRDAITLLQGLNTDYPQWAEPYFHLSLAHYSLREIAQAEQAATKAIQRNNNESKYHAFLAQIFMAQGGFEDAKKEAAIALRLNPKNLRAAIILGRSLVGVKEYGTAVKILKNMNDQVPNNIEILEALSLAALGSKDRDLGEEALTLLLEIDPAHNRGIALYLGLKYSDDTLGAETYIRSQLEKAPEDFRLHMILGGLLNKQDKSAEALTVFEKARDLNPDNPQTYLAVAQLLKKTGRQADAIAKYEELLEKQPQSIPAHMGIAALLEAEDNSAMAMDHYEKALQAKEDFAPAANNLAWLIASDPDGDLGKALQLAMVAKQAYPEDPHIADTLGWVHYQRRSYSLALTQFELALEKLPDNATITYHLALGQAGNGDKEKAISTLMDLLGKGIDFPERNEAEELLEELSQK